MNKEDLEKELYEIENDPDAYLASGSISIVTTEFFPNVNKVKLDLESLEKR